MPTHALRADRSPQLAWVAAALAVSSLLPPSAAGQESAAPTASAEAAPERVLVIRAGRLVVRPGQVIEGAQVLVRGGKIRAVGTSLVVPEGAQVLEAPVVCAGFFDLWSQIGLDPAVLIDRSAGAATRMADGLDLYAQGYLFAEALRGGITAVRVQGALPSRFSGQGVAVRTAPVDETLPERRLLDDSAGLWVTATEGDAFDRIEAVERFVAAVEAGRKYRESQVKFEREFGEWQKKIAEEQAKLEKEFKNAKKKRDKALADAKEKGKEFAEEKYKEDKAPKAPRFDRDNEVLAAIASGEQPAFVQADRLPEIRALLAALPRLGAARVVLVGAAEAHLCAYELAEAGLPVILAPGDEEAGSRFGIHPLERAAALERAGVYLLFGSGPGSPYASRDLPLAAARAVAFGLDPDSALAALTVRPARLLGLETELGSVEVGKSADLLLLSGDPLGSATQVQAVIANGQPVTLP
jgi:imidazolonepropionase-like amidohydrolase